LSDVIEVSEGPAVLDDEPPAAAPTWPRRSWTWLSGEDGSPRRATVAAWIALGLVWLSVLVLLLRWDFRETPRAGDENNWVIQSLSLAYGRNLSYDEGDIVNWKNLDWARTPTPRGIFFRANDAGYAFAKPYGYSAWLAPFVRVFGAPRGIAIGNAALLTALLAVALAILRTRLAGMAVPLLAGAFVFASYVYFYAFTTSVDLFLAFVTAVGCLGFLRAWKHQSAWWAALGAAATAFALADRITVGLALVPVLVVVLIRLGQMRQRAVVAGIGVVVYALAIFPFLYYSDFESVSAYSPPRYNVSTAGVPWAIPVDVWRDGLPDGSGFSATPSHFTPSGVWTRISDEPGEVPEAAAYFLVGRHTGLLVFMPLALVTFVLAAVWWRRLDRIGWALLVGIIGYATLYLVVYTDNFFGGGHSLGNRYFLQIAPLVLGVLAVLRPSGRVALIVATLCTVVTFTFLWPKHREPETAYLHIDHTTSVQDLLPFESNQKHQKYFLCAQGHGWAPPCLKVANK
jgi:hypothetical protein